MKFQFSFAIEYSKYVWISFNYIVLQEVIVTSTSVWKIRTLWIVDSWNARMTINHHFSFGPIYRKVLAIQWLDEDDTYELIKGFIWHKLFVRSLYDKTPVSLFSSILEKLDTIETIINKQSRYSTSLRLLLINIQQFDSSIHRSNLFLHYISHFMIETEKKQRYIFSYDKLNINSNENDWYRPSLVTAKNVIISCGFLWKHWPVLG